jgi:hypothetical protein
MRALQHCLSGVVVAAALYFLLNGWLVFIQWAVNQCVPIGFCS